MLAAGAAREDLTMAKRATPVPDHNYLRKLRYLMRVGALPRTVGFHMSPSIMTTGAAFLPRSVATVTRTSNSRRRCLGRCRRLALHRLLASAPDRSRTHGRGPAPWIESRAGPGPAGAADGSHAPVPVAAPRRPAVRLSQVHEAVDVADSGAAWVCYRCEHSVSQPQEDAA